uniref:Dual specificity phosphatase n=1 Tax=Panagrolaimus sp. JU765 TaxID=591449 RepID=A0AC34QWU7_9BILA
MSFLHRLHSAKKKLAKVETVVTKPDGSQLIEKRADDGSFKQEEIKDVKGLDTIEEGSESKGEVSKRRAKKVARMRQFGFVVDLKPDLQVANVAEGVYIGSQDVAADFALLTKHKITHILNVATGIKNLFPKNFRYFNVELLDEPSADIKQHFRKTNEHILDVVSNKGRILIHCNAGVSRCCTIAIAYIMSSERKSYSEALEQVKKVRPSCRPNDGFVKQLQEYEDELFRGSVCRTS